MPPALTRLDRLAATLAARTPRTVEDRTRGLAAVAIVLVEQPEAVLLIRRAEREEDRWSGQMAFPGGRWSEDDPDLQATARRETLEEVGVDLSGADVLGVLDDVAPRTPVLPPLIVRPYVFRLADRQRLVPNHEVAGAAWIELTALTQEGVYRAFEYQAPGSSLLLPGYHLPEGVVWGMTERILTPLLGMADRWAIP